MSKNTKDKAVDIDYANQAVPKDHVYDHAGIYIFLRKYVGWTADGSRT